MTLDRRINVAVDQGLLDQVDESVRAMRADRPGVKCSRADVVRQALLESRGGGPFTVEISEVGGEHFLKIIDGADDWQCRTVRLRNGVGVVCRLLHELGAEVVYVNCTVVAP